MEDIFTYIDNAKIIQSWEINTNSQGCYSEEHSEIKKLKKIRILAVGDSFVTGVGASLYKNTWLKKVEENLKNKNVEIIKCGIGGFGPNNTKKMLKILVKKYNPDYVISGFGINDILDLHYSEPIIINNKIYSGYTEQFLGREFILLSEKIYLLKLFSKIYIPIKRILLKDKKTNWSDTYIKDGDHEDEWKQYERILIDQNEYLAKIQKKQFLVIHPAYSGFAGVNYSQVDKYKYPYQRLKALNLKNIILFDLFEKFASTELNTKNDLYIEDGHQNDKGYQLTSEEVTKRLIDYLDNTQSSSY